MVLEREVSAAIAGLVELEKEFYLSGVRPLGADGRNVAFELLPLLASEDWCLRTKALLTIGRLGDAAVAAPLLEWLSAQTALDVQLQGLDCWWQLPLSTAERERSLVELLADATQPIIIRAVVWLVAATGGAAMCELFAEFVLSPRAKLIRDEMLADCWYRLADGLTAAELVAVRTAQPGLAVWLRFRSRPEGGSYGIYPSADYLWQQAAAAGVDRGTFKRLFHKPRKKDDCFERRV